MVTPLLRLTLGVTSIVLTAAQRCAEGVATACELGTVACWALSEQTRRYRA